MKASRSRDKGEPQQQQRDVAGEAGNRQEQHDKRASADPGDDHRGAWKAGSKRKRDDDESEKSTKTHKPAKEDHAEEEFKEEEECDAKGQRWRKIGARVSEMIEEANPLAELDARCLAWRESQVAASTSVSAGAAVDAQPEGADHVMAALAIHT